MKKLIMATLITILVVGSGAYFHIQEVQGADTSWMVGTGGVDWTNNVTHDNTTKVQGTGNIELRRLVDDYVSHWRFDENAGITTWDENTTNNNTGTWYGYPTGNWSTGKYGSSALAFDGSDDYVDCEGSNYFKNIPMTIEIWVKSSSLTPTSWAAIASKYPTGSNNGWAFDCYDNKYIFYFYRDSSNYTTFNNGFGAVTLGWTHLTAMINGSGNYLYKNGILAEQSSWVGNSGDCTQTTNLQLGRTADGISYFNGSIDELRIYNRTLSPTEINQTRDNAHRVIGSLSTIVKDAENLTGGAYSDVFQNVTIIGVNATETWFRGYWNYSTDNSSFAIENLGNLTTGGYVALGNQTRYGSMIVEFNTINATLTPMLHNITLYGGEGASANSPSIISYAPVGTIWPEVQDSQLFNITVNQSTQCRWYVNGTLKQTNVTLSTTHAYTNTSLKGGGCNVTAAVNNTNGNDSQTWLFEVGADSINMVILSEDHNNDSCRIRYNIIRIGSNVTYWNDSYNYTEAGRTYHKCFDNSTSIIQQTAISDGEILWFNSTTLLPIGIYYINATGASIGDYIPPNPTGLVNTTGNYWVNYTWNVGSGNITDSYNVSWNLTWYNTTTDTFMKKEVGASNWGNITVYAYNSSGNGTLSAGSLSDNVQSPAFVPGDYTPPNPTTLANTTGNYWVNFTWSSGGGANITDSYNVSWNLTWFNNTLTTYMQKDVGASGWANITIYAFNSSGNGSLSTGYISDEAQAPSAPIGDYIPPTPINLVNSSGNGWVNYTWNSGAGNITDSYNVSWNLTWYNTTLTAYMNDTVGEFGWANISVWAFNSSGNGSLSAGSISDETQAEGGTYTTSMGTTVYNLITYYGESNSTAEQFGLDIGSVEFIAKYNGSFYTHTMGHIGYNYTTLHGIGYYVYLNASGSSTYQRNNISDVPYNTQLFNRWNTIGWTNSTNTDAEGLATSIGSACKYTSMLNADGITYTTHTVGFTSNNHAVNKGEGYWVWVNTGVSWSRNS